MSAAAAGARAASRTRAAVRVARADGLTAVAQRAARAAYRRLDAGQVDFPLLPGDVADSSQLTLPTGKVAPPRGSRLAIAWVTTPPAAGSGGHTTMFRMIAALEAAGHTCDLYLYDRYRGDLAVHEHIVRRWWPEIRARVRSADALPSSFDVVVATSWQTAHVVATRTPFPARRLYLVQDFEPYFYARGSEYALAEDTYRFGFRCVAVGHMVAKLLASECDVTCDVAEFGCDRDIYRLTNEGARTGVAFYARPGVARRGHELASLALRQFAARYPEQEIHVFGDSGQGLPFPTVNHGRLRPAELAALYNTCAAGLALSFTNISLAAAEMLACGAAPVVNDHPFARADLHSPQVRWSAATPQALCKALGDAATGGGGLTQARVAAGSIQGGGWDRAQATMVRAVEEEVWGLAWPDTDRRVTSESSTAVGRTGQGERRCAF